MLENRRALAGDVLLAVTAFVLVLRLNYELATTWTPGLAVGAAVLMLLRRHRPIGVLVVDVAVTAVCILLDRAPAGMFITAGVLAYNAALYSARRRPWHLAAVAYGTFCICGTISVGNAWWTSAQFGLFAFVFGGAGAGDSIRMRRAYIAEVTERARQAELTREQEARRRVMDERLRIARELHDVVAHHIAVISVHAGAADHALRGQPDKVWPVLAHIRTAADTVLEEIKAVISVLRDENEMDSTEPAPGLERLPELLDALRATGFEIRHEQRGPERELPAVADLAAYRIVQEALTNAHRYGTGSAVLDVEFTPSAVSLEITNRVAAPRPERTGSGFGLLGMRERAAAAHGTITAGPLPGGRFRVRATLPAVPVLSERPS
ncbi:sensor histidine kinase [Actinoplanes rectilineatus]|uniref:sensor histidine kinase n=1 Tax=Actinoplanes rectilineatus TaxID=113571 RepID=UPI0005F2DCB1|nr:histidine kinase [Actinoplanes rectilineatus]